MHRLSYDGNQESTYLQTADIEIHNWQTREHSRRNGSSYPPLETLFCLTIVKLGAAALFCWVSLLASLNASWTLTNGSSCASIQRLFPAVQANVFHCFWPLPSGAALANFPASRPYIRTRTHTTRTYSSRAGRRVTQKAAHLFPLLSEKPKPRR